MPFKRSLRLLCAAVGFSPEEVIKWPSRCFKAVFSDITESASTPLQAAIFVRHRGTFISHNIPVLTHEKKFVFFKNNY